jgi:hypothetical protein
LNNCLPWDCAATDADGGRTAPAAGTQVVRRLIVVMLLTAAALDLTRCGLVMAAARYPAPTAGLVTAGPAAATLTARTDARPGHAAGAALAPGLTATMEH